VSETIAYEQFEQTTEPPAGSGQGGDLSRLSEIPMELSVELGRTHMTVGETLRLRVGSLVALERQSGEPAELLVNGTPIARGEVVVVEERYGLRITEILEEAPAPAPAPTLEPTPEPSEAHAAPASDAEAPVGAESA
jgi:flagellar motor switch protein FliN/FliY